VFNSLRRALFNLKRRECSISPTLLFNLERRIHPTYIYELIKQFCTQGIEEFVKDERGGANHRNLTDEQEAQIINKFKEKATAGQVISLNSIKNEYEKVRGKETANSTFYAFLERMKWRRVMPRGQHPKKASEEVIEASKKLTFN